MGNKYLWKKKETEPQEKKNNSRNVEWEEDCSVTYEQIFIQLPSKNRTADHMGTAPEKKMQTALKIWC